MVVFKPNLEKYRSIPKRCKALHRTISTGDSTLQERYKLLREQKEKTLQEMENLKLRLAVLNRKIDHYRKLLEGEEDTWSHEYMQKLIREGVKHE